MVWLPHLRQAVRHGVHVEVVEEDQRQAAVRGRLRGGGVDHAVLGRHPPPVRAHLSVNSHPKLGSSPRPSVNSHPKLVSTPRPSANSHQKLVSFPRPSVISHPTSVSFPRPSVNSHPTRVSFPRSSANSPEVPYLERYNHISLLSAKQ